MRTYPPFLLPFALFMLARSLLLVGAALGSMMLVTTKGTVKGLTPFASGAMPTSLITTKGVTIPATSVGRVQVNAEIGDELTGQFSPCTVTVTSDDVKPTDRGSDSARVKTPPLEEREVTSDLSAKVYLHVPVQMD